MLGPRSTGKTFLIHEQLKDRALVIDLLKSSTAMTLRNNPSELEAMVSATDKKLVVIDEIQKIPELLDEVHRLIEERGLIFLLTGSSARKLKRGNANMLGGRASQAFLYPLTWHELKRENLFELNKILRFGSLPRVYLSQSPQDELLDYVEVYLKEEIQAEALVRSLPNFSRFLKVAALNHSQIVNYTKVANDVGLSPTTIREYYQIIEDTLLGFVLPPWQEGGKRKPVSTAKHYLFDMGVCHTLSGTKTIDRNSNLYGMSFETFVTNEIRTYLSYRRIREELHFWRTKHQDEVDLIIGDHTAIEIKSASRVSPRDTRSLRHLFDEQSWKHVYLLSQDPTPRIYEKNISVMPWELFFEKLWSGDVWR